MGKSRSTSPLIPAAVVPRRFAFISGHPRSGTNWVSSLLNLHPHAFSDGEFHFLILRWAMDGFTSLPWYMGAQEPYRSVAERGLQQTYRELLRERARQKGRTDALVIADHTPRLFRVMISPPEARYIIVQRDGRDVLVSYTFHLLNTKAPEVVPDSVRSYFAGQLAAVERSSESNKSQAQRAAARELLAHEPWVRYYANFWADHILHDQRIYQDLACQGLAESILFLSYEMLRKSTEKTRVALYSHLGLDPSLADALSSNTNTAPGFGGREDVASFYRKGEPGDWVNYFTTETADWFAAVAGPALVSLGYEPDSAWSRGFHPGTPLAPAISTTPVGPRERPGVPAHAEG